MQKRGLYAELHKDYDKKRRRAQKELDAKISEIYELLPEIKQIDDEIAREGFKASFAAINTPENAENISENYKNTVKDLVNRKNALLKQAGISNRHLSLQYECKSCKDTGYVGKEECRCFIRARTNKVYGTYTKSQALLSRFNDESFDSFDFRYYSAKAGGGENTVSPRKNMEKIMRYCLKFTDSFMENLKKNRPLSNILFYGQTGSGKTFLCNAISKELMTAGAIVIYTDAFSLFNMINDIQFNKEQEDSPRSLDDILSADLLIIDDAGTEFSTSLSGASFFNIVNTRLIKGVSTIISTNLSPNELKELYSERVYSRIVGSYAMFEFFGEDIRRLKKYGRFPE